MANGTAKLAVGAAAVVGVGALAYCLCKGDVASGGRQSAGSQAKKKGVATEDISKDQVQEILNQIINSQEQMKGYMKDITRELLSKSLDFEQTYRKVKEIQPTDPLEKHGLSMMDFDQLLDKYQGDPNIRDSIKKIMGAPNPNSVASEKVQSIDVKKIIAVHNFMVEELEKLVQEYQALPNREAYDTKTVTIAVQAIVGSKIEGKFGFTSEDIESAVLMYHTMLATDPDFASINIKIQHTMGKLMGTPFEVEGPR